MSLLQIVLLSMALSVDSFAVSISGTVSLGRLNFTKAIRTAFILGFVQTVFFLVGFFAGDAVSAWISRWGRYVGFALLLYVGITMIIEAINVREEASRDFGSMWKIIVAAVATSIDAMAVGASFGLTGLDLNTALLTGPVIFVFTLAFALAGMYCGSAIGRRFGDRCAIVAGAVLILMGIGLLR